MRVGAGRAGRPGVVTFSLSSGRAQMHVAFKVIVLGDQDELVGPPQHSIIPITWSHDCPDDFGVFEQL